ncbi:hypothetical protein ACWDSL_50475 [Streptomyces sp. NPDC000941]
MSHVTGLHDVPTDLLHELFEVTANRAAALRQVLQRGA